MVEDIYKTKWLNMLDSGIGVTIGLVTNQKHGTLAHE
jgi:hypothetical protein